MSEARGQQQQEPSMEEILASIRRIISEDGTAPQEGAETAEEPAGAAPAAATEPAPLQMPEPADGDDALLLTEMVTEDGTVVSLADRAGSAEAAIEPAAEPPLPEPPLPEPPLPEPPMREPEPPLAEVAPEPAPEAAPEPGLELSELDSETGSEPGVGEPEAESAAESPVEFDEAPQPEPEPHQDSQPDSGATSAEPEMPTAARQPDMTDDPSQGLVSDTTFAATSSALSQLSRSIRRDKDFPLGGGRMVEDLVREALEPMLREWLDANLQTIVERLVRQEIERMVRRAEEES